MQVIRSIREMQKQARKAAASGKTIGLVPTMGYLHDGHLSLIRRAKKYSDLVITTIFVNPAQFAPNEDLSKYPRDEKGDIWKIAGAGGDIVFIPRVQAMYPEDFQTYVQVERLTKSLEGEKRPTHFKGVTTIVAKLFNITRPDVAVFGRKDYQQAIILRQMSKDLGYPIRFIIAPTVRERDGLAMSSRNKYFSADQRPEARCLYLALKAAKNLVRTGTRTVRTIETRMRHVIAKTAPTAEIDYIAFTDFDSLTPVKSLRKATICSLAVSVHGVRLIDNMRLL